MSPQKCRPPTEALLVVDNTRLVSESAFQLDFLVFILSYILILEVKRIHGFVHFGEYDQFMRVDTNIEMFPNPLEQCLRQEHLLKTFLQH
ncbi:nuclease-related domain-containing protein [Geomicrobium sediminis]|uniref:nuclease-related domain-containing protein n=1 Tax=Geomicrobium sediminis TaxID=1347788 RepID=UPI0019568165